MFEIKQKLLIFGTIIVKHLKHKPRLHHICVILNFCSLLSLSSRKSRKNISVCLKLCHLLFIIVNTIIWKPAYVITNNFEFEQILIFSLSDYALLRKNTKKPVCTLSKNVPEKQLLCRKNQGQMFLQNQKSRIWNGSVTTNPFKRFVYPNYFNLSLLYIRFFFAILLSL